MILGINLIEKAVVFFIKRWAANQPLPASSGEYSQASG